MPEYRQNNQSDKKYNEIINMVAGLNIDIIDLKKDLFDKIEDPLSLFPLRIREGHYNEFGYKLIAETVLMHIQK